MTHRLTFNQLTNAQRAAVQLNGWPLDATYLVDHAGNVTGRAPYRHRGAPKYRLAA